MEAVKAEKEAKREAKREAKLLAENTPPAAVVTGANAVHTGGLPVAIAIPTPTPVAMPNLARAAAELGVVWCGYGWSMILGQHAYVRYRCTCESHRLERM